MLLLLLLRFDLVLHVCVWIINIWEDSPGMAQDIFPQEIAYRP